MNRRHTDCIVAHRISNCRARTNLKDIIRSRSAKSEIPDAVPGAQWQAGITPDNDCFHVLLNGVPVPLAFAASIAGRWVMCFPEQDVDGNAEPVRLMGAVRIVRGE